MNTKIRGLLSAGVLTLSAADALAQHANFVLFGDPAAEAKDVPKENVFVHPVSSPFFSENSFITSDVRAWFVYHDFPSDSLIDDGDAVVGAVQVRLALFDCLQLVAYKDGYASIDTGLVDEDGLMDIGAGLKWAFWQDFPNQFHAALGAGYEFGFGDDDILQDDDQVRLWASVDKGFGKLHLGGNVNFHIATTDEDEDFGNSDYLSWHIRADYWVCEWFSPVIEFNGYHVLSAGESVLPFQGIDIGNFGEGEDDPVVSMALGAEIRPCSCIGIRCAGEFPLTDEDDLYGWRLTASVVFSF